MSRTALQALVGAALVNPEFGEKLLDGRRSSLIAEFDLTDEEQREILSIEASSPKELALGLYERLAT